MKFYCTLNHTFLHKLIHFPIHFKEKDNRPQGLCTTLRWQLLLKDNNRNHTDNPNHTDNRSPTDNRSHMDNPSHMDNLKLNLENLEGETNTYIYIINSFLTIKMQITIPGLFGTRNYWDILCIFFFHDCFGMIIGRYNC